MFLIKFVLCTLVYSNSSIEAFKPNYILEQDEINLSLAALEKELKKNPLNSSLEKRINVIKNKKRCEEF